jgi:hypothetical protein
MDETSKQCRRADEFRQEFRRLRATLDVREGFKTLACSASSAMLK